MSNIPESHQQAVRRALHTAFATDHVDDIRRLTGGMSTARVFRMVVRGRPYMLRLIMRDDPRDDPGRHFARMKAGTEAGVAPRIWYANPDDRVLITDFVDGQPFP